MRSPKGFENLGPAGIARRVEDAAFGDVGELVKRAERLRMSGGGLDNAPVVSDLERRVAALERQVTLLMRGKTGRTSFAAPIADQDGPLPPEALGGDSAAADRQARWRAANREKIRERDRLRRQAKKAMESK